ncbi:MAG: hypothetical protein AB7I50_25365 [Vicinamibacterales bacterium]
MNTVNSVVIHHGKSLQAPIFWGLVFGLVTVAAPLAFWWLDQATFHALSICGIATVYVGFALADGRPRVFVVETAVAVGFILIATVGVVGPASLLVVGYAAHGLKDLWQERNQYVANTRWWPPFCVTIDWTVAVILLVEIAAGVNFR